MGTKHSSDRPPSPWTGPLFDSGTGLPIACGAGGSTQTFGETSETRSATTAWQRLADQVAEAEARNQENLEIWAEVARIEKERDALLSSILNEPKNVQLVKALRETVTEGLNRLETIDVDRLGERYYETVLGLLDENLHEHLLNTPEKRIAFGLALLSGDLDGVQAIKVIGRVATFSYMAEAEKFLQEQVPDTELVLRLTASKSYTESIAKSSQGTPTAFPANFNLFRGVTDGGTEFSGSLNITGYNDSRTAATTNGRSIGLSGYLRKKVNDTTTLGAGFNLAFGSSGDGTDWRSTTTIGLSGFAAKKNADGSNVDASLGYFRIQANTNRAAGAITGAYGQDVLGLSAGYTTAGWKAGDFDMSMRIGHSHTVSVRGAYTESDATVNAAATTITGNTKVSISANKPIDVAGFENSQLGRSFGVQMETYGGTGATYYPLGVTFSATYNDMPVTGSVSITLAPGYYSGTIGAGFTIKF